LYEASEEESSVKNCIINSNGASGAVSSSFYYDYFTGNHIEGNDKFGMLCYENTLFGEFNNVQIHNNGFAEYVGDHSSFKMGGFSSNIFISDDDYGAGPDQYLLMNSNWDGINPVDIRGTNIHSIAHLYPADSDAWTFSGEVPESQEMLMAAALDFANHNYESARETLQLLLSEYLYSKDAITAVYYLYHIENLTTKDFAGLRDYLLSLDVAARTRIYGTIKKVVAKTLMKEKDYIVAIAKLEEIIANSEHQFEIISAMIDQGYCYLKLSESGERALPTNCTVKTATMDEYQAKVHELENQYFSSPIEPEQNGVTHPVNIVEHSNHPNPFNPTTTINFSLSTEHVKDAKIEIYNVKGQKVKTFDVITNGAAGSVIWNGRDETNKPVSSGIYFYKLVAGENTVTQKMLLLK